MRCWDCHKLIIVPQPDPARAETTRQALATQNVTCGNCGCAYRIVTTQLMGPVPKHKDTRTEGQREEDKIWRNRD
jgi:RNase P subunit RPR2